MSPSTDAVTSFGILGAGSWGTALAILLARNGLDVLLWGREEEIARLAADRENIQYLPGIAFPDKLIPETDLARVVACDEVLVVVPSQAFHEVLLKIASIRKLERLCWATKGLDPHTRRPLSTDAETIFPGAELAVISGPTFAVEVAQGLPTAVTAASTSESYSERLAEALKGETFRAYTSTDIIGVQLGGAVKNVMAIAAGISDGLGFGANARAALITRGLAEITRLGVALGAHPETFMGLAGLGDHAGHSLAARAYRIARRVTGESLGDGDEGRLDPYPNIAATWTRGFPNPGINRSWGRQRRVRHRPFLNTFPG